MIVHLLLDDDHQDPAPPPPELSNLSSGRQAVVSVEAETIEAVSDCLLSRLMVDLARKSERFFSATP